ncbi:hypothetical protein TFLX_04183 [Thermoflexales bacterium]|nr:hypothetical protein TFLX_04183 [Thermoflexales bacterium]
MKPQWQQQQEQMQRQLAYAWQQEQQQKRKKRAQQAQHIRSGGVNIQNASGSVGIGRDVVGRDKIEQHTYQHNYQVDTGVEEKSGCLVFLERAFAFVMALSVGGMVFAVFGAVIGSGLGGEGGVGVGVVVGLILAFVSAIVTANNVSRHRL